jgi:hypothetical protein
MTFSAWDVARTAIDVVLGVSLLIAAVQYWRRRKTFPIAGD